MIRFWIRVLAACLLMEVASPQMAQADVSKGISVVVDTDRCNLTILSNGTPLKHYRVAVGKPETPTPVGEWRVINKYKDWGGGFGTRWIGLDIPWGIYGIHGTNRPFSIGRNMSSGCIRMHNKDVEEIYEAVNVGTPVTILGHPLRHSRRIAEGHVGADVWLVQSRLSLMGFYIGKVDGRFGPLTAQAVKRFEMANGLPIDGIVSLHDYHKLGLEA